MTLRGYFMSNSVFVPALLDSDGSTFKDNRVRNFYLNYDYYFPYFSDLQSLGSLVYPP